MNAESESVEFKPSLSQIRDIVESVSAFSTTKGGRIEIGKDDKDGSVLGVTIGKRTVENLANDIKQNTDPPVFPSIRIEKQGEKDVIIIEILESETKPVLAYGRAYKRVGKTNQKLGYEEIRKLAMQSSKFYWDEQICEGATLEDIDWLFVEKEFIPLYEKTSKRNVVGKPKDLLMSLGCIKNNIPTNAGILLFGKNPQKFFINAYIALARYKGKEVFNEKLDYKEFTGNLLRQIDDCNGYIVEHTALMSKLVPGEVRRTDISEYGRFSVREIITNAVCHRDYDDQGGKIIVKMLDDRIEFYNIGGLPKWITPKNIASEQYSRNPTVAKVLSKVEYIEELGEGWDKIFKEHREHLLKPRMPEIKPSTNSTLVTLFSTREKFEEEKFVDLNERQKKAVEFIIKNKKITNKEYQSLNNVSRATASRELMELVKQGILAQSGKGRGSHFTLNA